MIDPLWQVEQVIAEMRHEVKFMPPSQWDERKRLLMWADRLTAALQPPPVPDQGWRDIATAPEGQWILLMGPYFEDDKPCTVDRFKWVEREHEELVEDGPTRKVYRKQQVREREWTRDGWSATLWMPLPDPPVERER